MSDGAFIAFYCHVTVMSLLGGRKFLEAEEETIMRVVLFIVTIPLENLSVI